MAGAGLKEREAQAPAILEIAGKGRVVVFAFGEVGSGVPPSWKATVDRPGVNLLTELSRKSVQRIAKMVKAVKQDGDVIIASIHWGGNWGYRVPRKQQEFAHQLIDDAGIDIIHGHSSHHVKALEVYQKKLIIYGCGDFLNDYEGIGGYERFRNDLSLMYFPSVNPLTGELVRLRMIPMRIQRFRLRKASFAEGEWLRDVLNREGLQFDTRVKLQMDQSLELVSLKPEN
jgi:poly-gamma-glutamate synthesis protein (capsule biosynthesis protein)